MVPSLISGITTTYEYHLIIRIANHKQAQTSSYDINYGLVISVDGAREDPSWDKHKMN